MIYITVSDLQAFESLKQDYISKHYTCCDYFESSSTAENKIGIVLKKILNPDICLSCRLVNACQSTVIESELVHSLEQIKS